MEKIPQVYAQRIQNEIDFMKKVESGTASLDDACTALKGEKSYFDLCRLSFGAIKEMFIYPNPIQNYKFTMKINLNANRQIRVELHDILGKFLLNLANYELKEGEETLQISLNSEIKPGIYLISVTTEKGEQVVQKIIVN